MKIGDVFRSESGDVYKVVKIHGVCNAEIRLRNRDKEIEMDVFVDDLPIIFGGNDQPEVK